MLVVISILAAVQLAVGCFCFTLARTRTTEGFIIACFLGALGGFVSFSLYSAPLVLQFTGLLLTGLVLVAIGTTLPYFLALGTCLSVAVIAGVGVSNVREWSSFKQRYPVLSLADRLSYEHRQDTPLRSRPMEENVAVDPARTMPTTTLEQVENQFDGIAYAYPTFQRTRALARIHESQVTQFVNSPGFGIGRGPRMTDLEEINVNSAAVPMPNDEPPTSWDTSAEAPLPAAGPPAKSQTTAPGLGQLESLNIAAQVDFASPLGFGYVKDRNHVVGFQSHHFTQLPELLDDPRNWTVRKVELVSLLKHDQPVVYVSKNLPRMDDLRGEAEVRPLDAFEAGALPTLRAGGNIESSAHGSHIRMLGAVRAAKQCLACHDVERGALLGAFSYVLEVRQSGDAPRPAPQPKPIAPAL